MSLMDARDLNRIHRAPYSARITGSVGVIHDASGIWVMTATRQAVFSIADILNAAGEPPERPVTLRTKFERK